MRDKIIACDLGTGGNKASLYDSTGKSVASAQTERFFADVDSDSWYMTTGNGFPPECYTMFKILWYRDNEPEMFSRTANIIGTKDYINYKLTGVIATDFSYASGSGVYGLRQWAYDDELLEAAGIDRGLLPEPVPSTEVLGGLTEKAAAVLGFTGDDYAGIVVVCGGQRSSL